MLQRYTSVMNEKLTNSLNIKQFNRLLKLQRETRRWISLILIHVLYIEVYLERLAYTQPLSSHWTLTLAIQEECICVHSRSITKSLWLSNYFKSLFTFSICGTPYVCWLTRAISLYCVLLLSALYLSAQLILLLLLHNQRIFNDYVRFIFYHFFFYYSYLKKKSNLSWVYIFCHKSYFSFL